MNCGVVISGGALRGGTPAGQRRGSTPDKMHNLKPVPGNHRGLTPACASDDFTIAFQGHTIRLHAERGYKPGDRAALAQLIHRARLPIDDQLHGVSLADHSC